MSSRDNIRTLATDLSEVLAWGEAAEQADGWAIWLKAATPQPTDEPWWLASLGAA